MAKWHFLQQMPLSTCTLGSSVAMWGISGVLHTCVSLLVRGECSAHRAFAVDLKQMAVLCLAGGTQKSKGVCGA